jgi:hypothetical protein
MNKQYTYEIPFNNTIWKAVAIFATLAIIGAVVPFEIHARRIHLTNNTVFYGGLLFTGLFLLVAVVLRMKSNNSKQNPYKLEITDSTLQVPKGKADVVKIPLETIISATEIGNKFNGSIIQVKNKNNTAKPIYIQGKGFSSESKYFDFQQELNKRILSN